MFQKGTKLPVPPKKETYEASLLTAGATFNADRRTYAMVTNNSSVGRVNQAANFSCNRNS